MCREHEKPVTFCKERSEREITEKANYENSVKAALHRFLGHYPKVLPKMRGRKQFNPKIFRVSQAVLSK